MAVVRIRARGNSPCAPAPRKDGEAQETRGEDAGEGAQGRGQVGREEVAEVVDDAGLAVNLQNYDEVERELVRGRVFHNPRLDFDPLPGQPDYAGTVTARPADYKFKFDSEPWPIQWNYASAKGFRPAVQTEPLFDAVAGEAHRTPTPDPPAPLGKDDVLHPEGEGGGRGVLQGEDTEEA